jgi:hypothetical protein
LRDNTHESFGACYPNANNVFLDEQRHIDLHATNQHDIFVDPRARDGRRGSGSRGRAAGSGAAQGDDAETRGSQDNSACAAAQGHNAQAGTGALLRELQCRQGRRRGTAIPWSAGLSPCLGPRQRRHRL